MKYFKVFTLIVFVLPGLTLFSQSQKINPSILQKPWNAFWITGPGLPLNMWNAHTDPSLKEYAVYKFRKSFELAAKPSAFIYRILF